MKSQLGVSMILQCNLGWYWSWVMTQWNKLKVLFSTKTTLFASQVQPKCKDILFVLWTTCFAHFLLLKGSSGQSKKEAAKCWQNEQGPIVQQHKSKTGMERGKLFKFILDNFIWISLAQVYRWNFGSINRHARHMISSWLCLKWVGVCQDFSCQ